MNESLGLLVLLVSLALLGFCLRNFYAPPSRFNIRIAWCAMALFSGMTALGAWMNHRLSKPIPHVFLDLPSAVGVQEVRLKKLGEFRGFAARFVRKADRAPLERETVEKLRGCGWEAPGELVGSYFQRSGFLGWDLLLLDHFTGAETMLIRYRVTEETGRILAGAALEVTAYSGELEGLMIGRGIMQMVMFAYLIALLLATSSVMQQQRRMHQAGVK